MSKVEEAQEILEKLGMPKAQYNEIAALTFLALCGITKKDSWKNAKRKSVTVSKGIMVFIKDNYEKDYAPNTRETFRRQVLHQFVQGVIADYNPDEPDLPTNSPRAHYAITKAALVVGYFTPLGVLTSGNGDKAYTAKESMLNWTFQPHHVLKGI